MEKTVNLFISASKLANAARSAALAVRYEKDRRFPILNCCRLTGDGNLRIYGTDLDTGIASVADCDVLEPGEAAVDAQRLADIAAKIRGDVSIQTTANGLVVKCGRSRFLLTMQSLDDFPAPLAVDGDSSEILLAAADIMAVFADAAAGAASSDARMYLAGPALFSEPIDSGYRLCAVGTDGVMLSYAATAAACPNLGAGVIIHRDTCKIAARLFGRTGAAMRLNSNLIELTSADRRLAAKLIGAEPTAWRAMVPPADVANTALIARADLVAALEKCLAVVSNLTGNLARGAPNVNLRWDAATGSELPVSFGDIRGAPAVLDAIPTEELSGKINIIADPRKLLRLLEGFDGASVRLTAGGRDTPLRIDVGSDRFAVLSPIRSFSRISEEAA
jgi:DNA polymerase III subunit beta